MIRIAIDIDDTLCDNNGRDYENAIPYKDVINKVNELYKDNYYIILYTARGMVSCKGDLKKIKEKNEDILITWLKKHNVKYHELIFGKVLADVYVDDKAMEVRDFVNSKFRKLNGGSGSDVIQLGRMVKKNLGSNENTLRFKEWEKEKGDLCLSPHVISYLYNGVYIDYIEGSLLSSSLDFNSFMNLLAIVFKFKEKRYDSFNLQHHLDNLMKNKRENDIEINKRVDFNYMQLTKIEDGLLKHASFSHGDLILSNIIKDDKQDLWFIDNNMNKIGSSYLLDLAKLRMSLDGYEEIFEFDNITHEESYKNILDKILKEYNIYNEVVILEYMHIIRTYRYKSEKDKPKVIQMLKNMEKEQKWKIE